MNDYGFTDVMYICDDCVKMNVIMTAMGEC